MILFRSVGRRHLHGYKGLTKDSPVNILEAKEGFLTYFPTLSPNGKPIEYNVKPGDKVKVGTLIGHRTDFEVPIYSSVSGEVKENKLILSPQIGRPIPHIVIESDGKNESDVPLKTVSLDDSKEDIFEAVKKAGIVGMGGAGFPLYVKYLAKGIDTLIINGVECEPFLTTDFVVMKEEVHNLLLGIKYLLKISGAEKAVIAIKVHKDEVRDAILKQLDDPRITIKEVPDVYPMGWEKLLIHQVLKREYEGLPAEAHVIVNNSQSFISIGKVLSTGHPISSRTVTVSGNAVKKPSNIICPIGTLASELIKLCDGITSENATLIPGGPMCGKSAKTDEFPILLQMGSLTLIEPMKLVEEPCLRCGSCTAYCPAGLQPVEIVRAFKAKDTERTIKLNVMSCVECGMCSYSCPSRIQVTEKMKNAKTVARFKLSQKAAANKK